MVNLKHKNWNLKLQEKTSGSNDQLSKTTKTSKTKEPGLALHLAEWLSMRLLRRVAVNAFIEIVGPEVDASLKWTPPQSKFKSGTCTKNKKKTTVRAHTTGNHPCRWSGRGLREKVQNFIWKAETQIPFLPSC